MVFESGFSAGSGYLSDLSETVVWMRYLFSVSHLAKYDINSPLTVSEIITNVQKSPIPHLYQSTTSAGLRSVSHKAAVLWNELPLTLKRMTSSTAFKCNIKKYLMSLY